MKNALLIALAALTILASGCTYSEQGTVLGGALGAGTGAIIGNQTGHNGEGALIGGIVGAIAGTAIGKANDNAAGTYRAPVQEIRLCPSCHAQIDVTGFAPNTQVRCPACNTIFVK
jgi:uncharacterized protein YcfJ